MSNFDLPFQKENYILMAGGLLAVVLGFILMSGGGSEDPSVYSEEIFSTRRWFIAPLVVLGGFLLVLIGILRKPKVQE